MSLGPSAYGYVRCPTCGLAVPKAALDGGSHVCEPDYIVARELALFASELGDWLGTATGRFAQMYAERTR